MHQQLQSEQPSGSPLRNNSSAELKEPEYYKLFRSRLEKHNIILKQKQMEAQIQTEQVSGSVLGDYRRYRVKFGYVDMLLQAYELNLSGLSAHLDPPRHIHGSQYQVAPTWPCMLKEDLHKAAVHKILRLLLASDDHTSDDRPRFDIAWDLAHEHTIMPSIIVQLRPNYNQNKCPMTKFKVDEKYIGVYEAAEGMLCNLLHFLSAYFIASTLAFMIIAVPSPPLSLQQRVDYSMYITWQTHYLDMLKPEQQILENILNPYASILWMSPAFNQHYCVTAKHALVLEQKLVRLAMDEPLSLLAQIYLCQAHHVVTKLYAGDHQQLVINNKSLLISLLTTLYNSVDRSSYESYCRLMLTNSKIGESKLTRLDPPVPQSKQPQQLGQTTGKGAPSSQEPQLSPKKKTEGSGMESMGQAVPSEDAGSRKKQLRDFSSEENDHIVFKNLRGINTGNAKDKQLCPLGEEHQYLLERHLTKKSKTLLASGALHPHLEQKKQAAETLSENDMWDICNYRMYYSMKTKQSSNHKIGLKQRLFQDLLVGRLIILQSARNIVKFIYYYSLYEGDSPADAPFDPHFDGGCTDFAKFWIAKLCQQVGEITTLAGSQSIAKVYEQEASSPQPGSRDANTSLNMHRNELIRMCWHMLIEILLINLRFSLDQFVIPSICKLRKLYEGLLALSSTQIQSIKQVITNIKDNESLSANDQLHLIIYSLSRIGASLLLIVTRASSPIQRLYDPCQLTPSVIQNFEANISYIQLLQKIKKESVLKMIGCYYWSVRLLLVEDYLAISCIHSLLDSQKQIIDQMAVETSLGFEYARAVADMLLVSEMTTFNHEEKEKIKQLQLSEHCLKALCNYFYNKVAMNILRFNDKTHPMVLSKQSPHFVLSKWSLTWMSRHHPLFGIRRLTPTKELEHAGQAFNNPKYLINILKMEGAIQLRDQKLVQAGMEESIDWMKQEADGSDLQVGLGYEWSTLVLTYLLQVATMSVLFFQYKPELEDLILRAIAHGVRLEHQLTFVFITSVLKFIHRLDRSSQILDCILSLNQKVIALLQQIRVQQERTTPDFVLQCQILEEEFEEISKKNALADFVGKFYPQSAPDDRRLLMVAYCRLRYLFDYLYTSSQIMTRFMKNMPIVKQYIINLCGVLAKWNLFSCQVQLYNHIFTCKIDSQFGSELMGGKKWLTSNKILEGNFIKQKGGKFFPIVLDIIQKMIMAKNDKWIQLFEKVYQSVVNEKKSQELLLKQYMHLLGDDYPDRLMDGRMAASPSLFLVGLEYLRLRKTQESNIHKHTRLLQAICVRVQSEKKVGNMTDFQWKYLSAILHYVTAQIASLKSMRQSKMQYHQFRKYWTCIFLSSYGLIPTMNFYHKMHRLCEKQGEESNRRKIYKSLCSKCQHVVNKDIRPKRVLLFLINRVRRYEHVMDYEKL